jgi:putative SOS response-associated peptidase YedK
MRIPSTRWPGKPPRDKAKHLSRSVNQPPRPEIVTRTLSVYRLHPETRQLVETSMQWGLIPNYVDERPSFQPLYAPAETIARRRMFREAYHKRRCIVPMREFHLRDRYRERRTIAHKDGKLLNFAGIWENWRDPNTSKWERTFAIVTVKANGLVASIHDRMPLIMDEANLHRWLDSENDPCDLLRPSSDIQSVLTVLT